MAQGTQVIAPVAVVFHLAVHDLAQVELLGVEGAAGRGPADEVTGVPTAHHHPVEDHVAGADDLKLLEVEFGEGIAQPGDAIGVKGGAAGVAAALKRVGVEVAGVDVLVGVSPYAL